MNRTLLSLCLAALFAAAPVHAAKFGSGAPAQAAEEPAPAAAPAPDVTIFTSSRRFPTTFKAF